VPGLLHFITSCFLRSLRTYILIVLSPTTELADMNDFHLTAPLLEQFFNTLANLSPQQTFALIVSAGTAVSSAIVARKKARSAYRWFVVGLFLNVIGLALALLVPNRHTHARCPACHGIVPIRAPSCMYCHTQFLQPKTLLEKLKAKLAV
jgi:ribosomal protein L40E